MLAAFLNVVSRQLREAHRSVMWRYFTIAMLIAIFVLDAFVPLGFNIGAFYVPVVLAALLTRRTKFVVGLSVIAAALVICGALLSPSAPRGVLSVLIWTNRGFSILSIAVTALLVAILLHIIDELSASNAGLLKAQDAIDEKRRLLQVASETGSIGGWTVSVPNFRVTWSDEVARIHGKEAGYSPTVDEGIAFYAAHDARRFACLFEQCVYKGVSFDEELQIIAAGGRRVWVRSVGRAERGGDGSIIGVQGAIQDITTRKEFASALAKSQLQTRQILEAAGEGIHGLDKHGRIVFENAAACRMFGAHADEMLGKDGHRTIHHHHGDGREYPAEECPIFQTLQDGQSRQADQDVFFRRDGSSFPVEYTCSATFDETGAVSGAVVSFRDTTERRRYEERIRGLNRVYALLSRIGTTIMHVEDRQNLFEAACRIGVETGGFRACWIGLIDPDMSVRPVACAGATEGYLDEIRIVTEPAEEAKGPFGRAVHEDRNIICNDTEADPAFAPWREAALARGYRSAAVFPLRLTGKIFGAMIFYAETTYFFNDEEVKLLDQLAADVAFAVEHIDREERKRQAEETLRESEARLRAVFDQAAVGICVVSMEYRFLRVNERFCRIVGYPAQELLGMHNCVDSTYTPDRDADAVAVARILAGEPSVTLEKRYVRKDQALIWAQLTLSVLRSADGEPLEFIGIVIDITGQRRAQQQLLESQQLLRMASQVSRLGAWSVRVSDMTLTWSDELCEIAELPPGHVQSVEEAIGFYAEPDRNAISEAVQACIEDGKGYDIELDFVTARGNVLRVRSIGQAIRDATGRIVRVQGGFQDVSERKRAEAQLIESLQRFRDLANAMPMIVWTADADGVATFYTPAAHEFTGVPQSELLGEGWLQVVHPDDRERCLRTWGASRETGVPYSIEFRIRRHDDVFRWHLSRALPVRDASGAVVKWYGTATDIHDQKVLEETSRQLAERLTTTLESMTDAFLTLDRDWRFVYLNAETGRLLQRSWQSLHGKNIWDEFAPAIGTAFDREFHRAVAENRSVTFEEFYSPLNAWFDVRLYPSPEGLTVYFRDVTDKRRSEAQLKLLEAAVSRLNDIVLITEAEPIDAGPRIVFVNDAFERLTGYRRDEVLGKSPRILQGPDTQRAELDRIRSALEQWQPVRSELLNYTKAGQPFWIEMDIVPLADDKGRYTHWVAVERDVSERHALEEQLRQSQRLESVGQLTGGVAHDFNNVLTVILGNAELLCEQLTAESSMLPFAQMIVEAAQRGANLTQGLLAFARRQPLEPTAVDANALIAGMDGLVRRALGEHIEIEFIRSAGLHPALVDPAQLESALLNLCLNARDAMPRGGRLTIETGNARLDQDYAAQHPEVAPGAYVLVAISDTGEGIPAEALVRVFEPFYTTKPKGKGTGLGLSMVYGFVKQSRGHVTIYSEPGLGTTVKMYLPQASTMPQTAELRSDPVSLDVGGGQNILLVEDDPLVRRYAYDQLVLLGYRVLQADNGSSALQIIEEREDIDLLFTDVVMPGAMSGRQLAEAAVRLRPDLQVLYTSGYTESAVVHHGRLDPGVQLLSKPYRREELARKIRDVLQRQAKRSMPGNDGTHSGRPSGSRADDAA